MKGSIVVSGPRGLTANYAHKLLLFVRLCCTNAQYLHWLFVRSQFSPRPSCSNGEITAIDDSTDILNRRKYSWVYMWAYNIIHMRAAVSSILYRCIENSCLRSLTFGYNILHQLWNEFAFTHRGRNR